MDIETLKNKIPPDPIAIWSITPNGKILGQKIKDGLKGSTLFVSAKIGGGVRLDGKAYLLLYAVCHDIRGVEKPRVL